jgi:hypothetical protein
VVVGLHGEPNSGRTWQLPSSQAPGGTDKIGKALHIMN